MTTSNSFNFSELLRNIDRVLNYQLYPDLTSEERDEIWNEEILKTRAPIELTLGVHVIMTLAGQFRDLRLQLEDPGNRDELLLHPHGELALKFAIIQYTSLLKLSEEICSAIAADSDLQRPSTMDSFPILQSYLPQIVNMETGRFIATVDYITRENEKRRQEEQPVSPKTKKSRRVAI